MTVDVKLSLNLESRMSPNQARKRLSEILNVSGPNHVTFSKHSRDEMKKDSLTAVDVVNVLKGGHIYKDPELENGTYRYRVETERMLVVIVFVNPDFIRCVTAWRKS